MRRYLTVEFSHVERAHGAKKRWIEALAAAALVLTLLGAARGMWSLKESREAATTELTRILGSDDPPPAARYLELLRAGADPRTCGMGGETLLHAAAALGDPDLLNRALAGAANVNVSDGGGFTPLLNAARAGDAAAVRRLAAAGADVNCTSARGISALGIAAREGHTESVRALLECGARMDYRRGLHNRHTTALMYAVRCGNPETVQLLLAAGADRSLKNQEGQTALNLLDERLLYQVELDGKEQQQIAAIRRLLMAKSQELSATSARKLR